MPFDDTHLKKLIFDQKSRNYKMLDKIERILSSDCKAVVNNCLEPDVSERWNIFDIMNHNWFKKQHKIYY